MLVEIEPWQSLDGLAPVLGVTGCTTIVTVTTNNEQSSSTSLSADISLRLKHVGVQIIRAE